MQRTPTKRELYTALSVQKHKHGQKHTSLVITGGDGRCRVATLVFTNTSLLTTMQAQAVSSYGRRSIDGHAHLFPSCFLCRSWLPSGWRLFGSIRTKSACTTTLTHHHASKLTLMSKYLSKATCNHT